MPDDLPSWNRKSASTSIACGSSQHLVIFGSNMYTSSQSCCCSKVLLSRLRQGQGQGEVKVESKLLLSTGLSYARWSTEAISALEFSQYEHYMQPRIHTIMSQIGYCGLDSEPEHGAQPGAPVNGAHSLDSFVYCKGYVAWDCVAILTQVCHVRHIPQQLGDSPQSCCLSLMQSPVPVTTFHPSNMHARLSEFAVHQNAGVGQLYAYANATCSECEIQANIACLTLTLASIAMLFQAKGVAVDSACCAILQALCACVNA